MAAHAHDDDFHEIQLNGKQLVFFFMAATVVLVVVFLCGVLVGRGVRTERAGSATESAAGVPAIEPVAPPPASVAPSAGSDPTKAPPPPPAEEVLTYNERLQKPNVTPDVLKQEAKIDRAAAPAEKPVEKQVAKPVEKAVVPSPRVSAPIEKPAPRPADKAPPPQIAKKEPVAALASSASASSGSASAGSTSAGSTAAASPASTAPAYVVQVAALNVRSEADAIAKRLTSKGYDAYVLESAAGAPQVYRVRVGRFGSRRDAQTMAAKLQKEERFKPWVTR